MGIVLKDVICFSTVKTDPSVHRFRINNSYVDKKVGLRRRKKSDNIILQKGEEHQSVGITQILETTQGYIQRICLGDKVYAHIVESNR